MELHEIIDDWCDAADRTNDALRRAGTDAEVRRRKELLMLGNGAGPEVVVFRVKLRQGYVETALREIDEIMRPSTPLTQRWSGAKRRQTARRSLRNLMAVYCEELLEDFEEAVEARAEWIGRYREFVHRASANDDGVRRADFLRLGEETEATTAALTAVRDQLKELIKEKYPMGGAGGRPAPDQAPA
ncbi:hypothetical protein [Streptomyces sp. NPDC052114]|uniref:hypothetical protein n=1 Tax=unclassified Streptomyces TaxID=2593676 RepID=UPI00343F8972